jgi:hypothetical protein
MHEDVYESRNDEECEEDELEWVDENERGEKMNEP